MSETTEGAVEADGCQSISQNAMRHAGIVHCASKAIRNVREEHAERTTRQAIDPCCLRPKGLLTNCISEARYNKSLPISNLTVEVRSNPTCTGYGTMIAVHLG